MIYYNVGQYILKFPDNCKYEIFNDPNQYHGIIFISGKYKYQIIDCLLGTRLIINGDLGEMRDMPFNRNTMSFLPDFVTVVIK